jgi:undecaprenyl-diphosphatase
MRLQPAVAPRGGAQPVRSSTRRDSTDAVRIVLGLAVLLWASLTATSVETSTIEINLFRLINQLPGAAGAPLIGLMQLGALPAVPVIALVCLFGRRVRLARLLAIGGITAWIVAKVLAQLVAQRLLDERVSGAVLHGAVTPGLAFPSTHVAVAAALATVASPYLSRSGRRSAWFLVGAVAVARIYVGAHFPVDVIGGFAIGWIVGSALHLVLGAPRGLPDPRALSVRLDRIGHPMAAVEPLPGAPASFRVQELDGTMLHMRVVDRDRREADWLYRAWRLIAFRDRDDGRDLRGPDHAVEHEALALMVASRAEVPVPQLYWTARLAEGESVVAREWLSGQPLADAAVADPGTLTGAWQALRRLHDAGLAHGNPSASAFVAGPSLVSCVDLRRARLDPTADDKQHDIAGLLASSATIVGPATAVSAARDVVGASALLDALPHLQPLALSRSTRAMLRATPLRLEDLRAMVAGLGTEPPDAVQRPIRVLTRNLGPLLLGLVALALLLTQAGNVQTTLNAARRADIAWLMLAATSAALGYVMAAVALIGATPQPLALGRTSVVQLAGAFTNRLTPAGLGGVATNVRYLERAGSKRSAAVTAVGADATAGFVVHVLMLAILLPLVGLRSSLRLPSPPDLDAYWAVAVFIVVSLAILGVWNWRRRFSSFAALWPRADVAAIVRSPRRLLLLLGGSAGVTSAQAFVLVASLEALGVHLPVVTVVAVFVAGTALAAAAPTPGGLGALEAALVAGLAQVGAPTAPAIAAVLTARLIGYWLPVLPGWLAYRLLRQRETL